MANKRPGPRQPLSQARPERAAQRAAARPQPGARPLDPQRSALNARRSGGDGRGAQPGAQGVLHNRKRRGIPKGTALAEHAATVYDRLARAYPDAHCALDHRSPFELLVATVLSAQTTDKRVNMVTPALFATYPTARALAAAPLGDVEKLVKTTGFFRNKAKNIVAMAQALVARHGGEVPRTMSELTTLPGVGRKTANVVLGNAFGENEGVVVDTHVTRLSARLGLTAETDPVKIEQALMPLFPRDEWTMLSHLLIAHGRAICDARKPKCGACGLCDVCPSATV
jgi:endonuclease III